MVEKWRFENGWIAVKPSEEVRCDRVVLGWKKRVVEVTGCGESAVWLVCCAFLSRERSNHVKSIGTNNGTEVAGFDSCKICHFDQRGDAFAGGQPAICLSCL